MKIKIFYYSKYESVLNQKYEDAMFNSVVGYELSILEFLNLINKDRFKIYYYSKNKDIKKWIKKLIKKYNLNIKIKRIKNKNIDYLISNDEKFLLSTKSSIKILYNPTFVNSKQIDKNFYIINSLNTLLGLIDANKNN